MGGKEQNCLLVPIYEVMLSTASWTAIASSISVGGDKVAVIKVVVVESVDVWLLLFRRCE